MRAARTRVAPRAARTRVAAAARAELAEARPEAAAARAEAQRETGGSAGVDGGAGSGGTAGTDGGAGASGAGGTGGTGGCTKASDCTNPDAAHCTVSCVSQACVVAAADKDGDGHGAKQCAAAPGDDCDDGHKTVYPGAPGICDGLDNNCNGKADLEDGLTLSGTNKVFATSSGDAEFPEVAWSPTASMYGVAWVDTRGASPQVYFARMNQAGAKVGSDTPISNGTAGKYSVRIALGNNAFGVVWQEDTTRDRIRFVRVTGGGSIVGSASTVVSGSSLDTPALAYHDKVSRWVVGWSTGTGGAALDVQELDNTGTPLGSAVPVVGTGANIAMGAGVIGDQIGVLYAHGPTAGNGTNSLRWAELDASLGLVSDAA